MGGTRLIGSRVPVNKDPSLGKPSGVCFADACNSERKGRIFLRAPPDRLGLSIFFPAEGGDGALPFVKEILPTCPFKSKLRIGDKLLSIAGRQITKGSQLFSFEVGVEQDLLFTRDFLTSSCNSNKNVAVGS